MADKRISQLVDRGTVANNDVVPIVVSGATTTNKATISSIQTYMQGNLDLGVTSVGITLGSSGTDVSVSGSPITSSGNITINLPTASATNRGLLSAADWTTFNNKANAGDYVTLATTQTITAQKTFTTSGSSDTMIISHGSGSGFALDVLKAGNGEAIRVTKTSGSGNAMTISGGNFEAPTIVKTGGTSSQFLKADGSVDSNTYLTTGSAGSTYVPYSGAAANVDLGVYNLTASAIIANGSGSSSGIVHLESNAFHSLVNGYGSIASGTTNQFNLYQTTGAGVFRGAILSLNSITESATRTYTLPNADGTLALSTDLGAYLPLTGGTLTGALNGTSASFSELKINSTGTEMLNINNVDNSERQGIRLNNGINSSSGFVLFNSASSTGTTAAGFFIIDQASTSLIQPAAVIVQSGSGDILQLKGVGGAQRVTIASTGAATFSSSVSVNGAAITKPLSVYAPDATGNIRLTRAGTSEYMNISTFNISVSGNDLQIQSGTSNTLQLNPSGGNVGIGVVPSAWSGIVRGFQVGQGASFSANTVSSDAYMTSNCYYDGSTWRYIKTGEFALSYDARGGTGDYVWQTAPSGTAGAAFTFTERMRINSGGNVDMGTQTASAAERLRIVGIVSGSAQYGIFTELNSTLYNGFVARFFNTATNAVVGSITQGVSATSFNTSSDYRLKQNVLPVEGALSKLEKLKPCTFNFIADPEKEVMGFLAHEVQEVMPQAVHGQKDEVEIKQVEVSPAELDEEGNIITEAIIEEKEVPVYQGIDHSKLVPLLVAAIQELKTEIDSLKNQMQ